MKGPYKPAIKVACMMSALIFLISCSGIDPEHSAVIRLSATTGLQTRITGVEEADESALNAVTFYVFDDTGTLEASASWEKDTGASCQVKDGVKKIYAIANCTLPSPPLSESALLSTISSIYDNSPDNLVMSGWMEADIDMDKSISISVRRLAGKVEIDEIKVALKDKNRSGITIKGIYLTNVNSSISFGLDAMASPDDWINKAGYSKSSADRLTFEAVEVFIPDEGSHEVQHTFYAYPNCTVIDSHDTELYCARFTRLVLDTDAGFYHLDIPDLLGNNSYIFKSVTITGEGSSGPETDDGKSSCGIEFIVEGWRSGESIIEYI